ncbi:MAG TPA: hypothetical protein PLL20_19270 [Phycisphaerae bacterium]|nr:hypothetical protein [Phycisphaerae bacterium]
MSHWYLGIGHSDFIGHSGFDIGHQDFDFRRSDFGIPLPPLKSQILKSQIPPTPFPVVSGGVKMQKSRRAG